MAIQIDWHTLRADLRAKRERNNVSLRDLTKILGYDASFIHRFEVAGKGCSAEFLLTLCDWLGHPAESYANTIGAEVPCSTTRPDIAPNPSVNGTSADISSFGADPRSHLARSTRIKVPKPDVRQSKPPVPLADVRGARDTVAEPVDVPASPFAALDAGWIGIEFKDVTRKIARNNRLDQPAGIVVFDVLSYGPASKAGIRQGDVVVAVDGRVALNREELGALYAAIKPCQKVKTVILRAGDRLNLDLTVGRLIADNTQQANAGNVEAMHRLGLAYEHGRGTAKDAAKAARWYRKAAELGNASAQFGLAALYGSGTGVTKNNRNAVSWYRLAADQGHASAQVYLAWRYQFGQGVAQDHEQAIRWFQASSDQGHPFGYLGLATCYEQGLGVKRDVASAAGFYQKASALGSIPARNNLAGLFWQGNGVTRDRKEATRLWRSSALGGSKSAEQNLRKLGIELFDCEEIQSLLTTLGYDPGPVDGKPGRNTRAALEQFQSDRGLAVNGALCNDVTAALLTAEQDMRRQALAERFGIIQDQASIQTTDAGEVRELEYFG